MLSLRQHEYQKEGYEENYQFLSLPDLCLLAFALSAYIKNRKGEFIVLEPQIQADYTDAADGKKSVESM